MDDFIRQLEQLLDDVPKIMLDMASNMAAKAAGVVIAGTPVISGTLKGAWHSTRAVYERDMYFSEVINSTEYASHVEDGHRIVNKAGDTTGFVPGRYMLKKGMDHFTDNVLDSESDLYLNRRIKRYFT